MDNTRGIEIKKKIREFVISNFLFGNESKSFTDTDSFLQTGIIDSTGMLDLIDFVETNYNLKLEDTELVPENLDSLENLSIFIQKKQG